MKLSRRILLNLWCRLNTLMADAPTVDELNYWRRHRDRFDALCKAQGWFD